MAAHLSRLLKPLSRNWIPHQRTHEVDMTELTVLTRVGKDYESHHHPHPDLKRDTLNRSWRYRFRGWRFGVMQFAAWATIAFAINLTLATWGAVRYESMKGRLMEGDCTRVRNLNRNIHILINVLSTVLLSGSNYCMQCLSAPTRAEVDKAHAVHRWLDIGVLSIRNLRHISRGRLCIWMVLAISSVPLHLLYNSAVYASVSTNDYSAYLVTDAFLEGEQCVNCTWTGQESYSAPGLELRPLDEPDILWKQASNGSLDRLEPLDCLTAYATALQSNRGSVLLVTNETQQNTSWPSGYPARSNTSWSESTQLNNTHLYWSGSFSSANGTDSSLTSRSYNWICSGLPWTYASTGFEEPIESMLGSLRCANEIQKIRDILVNALTSRNPNPPTWCVGGQWRVKYCLSEPYVPRCRLHFSPVIGKIVTALNFLKAVSMFLVVFILREDPLLTMGDAVASFLDKNDPMTSDQCLMSLDDRKLYLKAGAQTWNYPYWHWKNTTSKTRRTVTLSCLVTVVTTITVLLVRGLQMTKTYTTLDAGKVFSLGLGAVDTRALIVGSWLPNDMISLVLLANSPQVILSFLYFAYNGLFTAMMLGYEWTSYVNKRKGLRVSQFPTGFQRTTYFLQLPYRYAIPLTVLSGALHWMVSQSIFVVSVDTYTWGGRETGATNKCGYSPIAMLVVILVGVIMIAAAVVFGRFRYAPGMPLAGSCSLAISAACHSEKDFEFDGILSEQKLQWGVVGGCVDGIWHCAFSPKLVGRLKKGRLYS